MTNQDIVFKPGSASCIVPYTGEPLTAEEEYQRYDAHGTHGRYLLAQGPLSLDSIRTLESPGRFANHKVLSQTNAKLGALPGSLRPLVQSQFRDAPWILATKNLKVGQEIFVNYGPDYDFYDGLYPDEIRPKRPLCK